VISYIRNLSATAEFLLIVFLCLGVQSKWAVRAIIRHSKGTAPRHVKLGNAGVLRVVILELLCLSAALWIGSVRGWSLATFGLRISWAGTLAGILLYAALIAVTAVCRAALRVLRIEAPSDFIFSGITLPFVILLAIVNPFFEETVESGYFIHALQGLGMWPAVLASALFVGFLHAYLGFTDVMTLVFWRIVIGLVYWRWRQLWPLVIAHSLADIVGLTNPWPWRRASESSAA
jgi:uncharacterized protein